MLAEGASAPDIELDDQAGGKWSLSEALKAGAVVLAFFKISCPTCQFTLPFLQRLVDGAVSGAPQLVAISQDDAEGTAQFQRRFQVSLRTLYDKAHAYTASNAFRIGHVPALFAIGRDGRISMAVEGFSKAHLEKLGELFGAAPFRPGEQIPAMRPG
jgi:peroxiredoxin